MTKTINIANIGIGMDVEKLKEGGIKARNELSALTRALNAGTPAFEKFAEKQKLLDRALATGGINQDTYDRMSAGFKQSTGFGAVEEASKARIKKLVDSVATAQEQHNARVREYNALLQQGTIHLETHSRLVKKSAAEMEGVGKQDDAMSQFLTTISIRAIAYTAAFKAIAASKEAVFGSLKAFGEFESSMVKLTVLTGSRSFAKQLYQDMRDLDKQSPLSTAAIQRSATTLLGYGVSAKSVMPALRSLSEISMGNEERFQGLSLAYAQVMANGRLMGQEVIQMVNAGFNPLVQISKDTGKSLMELRKQMEDGGLGANLFAKGVENATKKGGMFHDMNKLLSKTLEGRQASFQNNLNALSQSVGKELAGPYSDTLAVLDKIIARTNELIAAHQKNKEAVKESMSDSDKAMMKALMAQSAIARFMFSDFFREDPTKGLKEQEVADKKRDEIIERQVQMEKKIKEEVKQRKDAIEDQINVLTKGVVVAEQIRSLRALSDKKFYDKGIEVVNLKTELDFLTKRKSLMEEINALLNTEAEQRARLREDRINLEGMKPWQADELAMLEKQLKKNQEIAEAMKEQAESAKERVMNNIRESDRVFNDQKTPKQKFEEDIAKLRELREAGPLGGIDQNTFEQAATAAARKFLETMKAENAPTLRANTREAYTFMQQENARKKRDEEAKKLAREQIGELKQINQKIGNLEPVRRWR
jgi:tape measure domain-containing protein